jgi:DMSO/TMAO reductase YedYZ molybdopterin-dependent catalytic subunit
MRGRGRPPIDARGPGAELPFFTPNDAFYRFANGAWPEPLTAPSLTIAASGKSTSVPWSLLAELPRIEVVRTICCDGNGYIANEKPALGCQYDPEASADHPPPENWPWRFGGIGTAAWGTVSIGDLFEAASLPMDGPAICVLGVDGYRRWFPVELARTDALRIALTMNGQPLPHPHGAPARLVVGGQYGAMSVKWVVGLRAAEREGARPFEGDSPDHYPVKPVAFFTMPHEDAAVEGAVEIAGAAYAGEHAVKEALVWANDDRPSPATLIDQPAPYVWTRFRARFELPPGRHTLTAACADTLGRVSMPQSAYGDAEGWGGLHTMRVDVR